MKGCEPARRTVAALMNVRRAAEVDGLAGRAGAWWGEGEWVRGGDEWGEMSESFRIWEDVVAWCGMG